MALPNLNHDKDNYTMMPMQLMHEAGVKNDLSHNPHLYYADKYTMMPMYLVHEAYENLWLDVNKCLNLTSLIPCWS